MCSCFYVNGFAPLQPAGATTQAEAMRPDLLEEVVRDAIFRHVDRLVLDRTLDRERRQREEILDALDAAPDEASS